MFSIVQPLLPAMLLTLERRARSGVGRCTLPVPAPGGVGAALLPPGGAGAVGDDTGVAEAAVSAAAAAARRASSRSTCTRVQRGNKAGEGDNKA
jgi:hypothetical protein